MGLIRLLLALSVLIEHSGPLWGLQLVGGELAVQSFYAVSGFYMAMILDGPYQGQRIAFFRNRLLRLFPMYWLILAATAISSAALWWFTSGARPGLLAAWQAHGHHLGAAPMALLGLAIPLLIFQDATFFLGITPITGSLLPVANFHQTPIPLYSFLPVAPSWSLALELYFYLLAPWLIKWRVRWIAALAICSLGLRFALNSQGLGYDPWSYRFFPTSLVFFLAGLLAWKLSRRWNPKQVPRRLAMAIWIGVLAAILAWKPSLSGYSIAFVLALSGCLPIFFSLTKNWHWDRWIGDLSFPLYLIHFQVFAVTPRLPTEIRFGAALLIAAGLQYFVAARINRWRSNPSPLKPMSNS